MTTQSECVARAARGLIEAHEILDLPWDVPEAHLASETDFAESLRRALHERPETPLRVRDRVLSVIVDLRANIAWKAFPVHVEAGVGTYLNVAERQGATILQLYEQGFADVGWWRASDMLFYTEQALRVIVEALQEGAPYVESVVS